MAASPLILSRLKCFSSVTGNRHRVPTWICKLLLPKFNTWKPVQIERKKGSLPPFGNAAGGFSAMFFCHGSQMTSPLQCNRDAVTVQSRCRYGIIATRLHRNGKTFWPKTGRRHCQRAEGYPFSALFAPVSKC